MKPRLLLIIAIIAGLLAVLLVQVHLSRQKGPSVKVFRASETVTAGETLGSNVEVIELPGENLFPGILEEAPTAEMRDFVSNTPVKQEIRSGEIVLYRHLESTVDPGIRPEIPAGMKAISIDVDEVTSVSHFIEPGDLVDVIGTVPVPVSQTRGRQGGGQQDIGDLVAAASAGFGGGNEELMAVPLVQAVKVLAVGNRYRRSDDPVAQLAPYGSVTLLVTLEEAQKLALARASGQGGMTLVLRAPGDQQKDPSVRPISLTSPNFDRVGNQ